MKLGEYSFMTSPCIWSFTYFEKKSDYALYEMVEVGESISSTYTSIRYSL